MDRYRLVARAYDALSAEPVYRAGRRAALPALRLGEGGRVLDLGCGTGLNLPALVAAVGPTGQVVGVDRSAAMLDVARRKAAASGWAAVRLVEADLTRLGPADLAEAGVEVADGLDAAVATYCLSLTGDSAAAWRAARAVLRPGARVAVVDMQPPTGRARLLSPLARLACRLGGSDILDRPWRAVETDLVDVEQREARGGHVVVTVGTWPGSR